MAAVQWFKEDLGPCPQDRNHHATTRQGEVGARAAGANSSKVNSFLQGMRFLSPGREQGHPLFGAGIGGALNLDVDSLPDLYEEPTWGASVHNDRFNSNVGDSGGAVGALTGLDRKIAEDRRQLPVFIQEETKASDRGSSDSSSDDDSSDEEVGGLGALSSFSLNRPSSRPRRPWTCMDVMLESSRSAEGRCGPLAQDSTRGGEAVLSGGVALPRPQAAALPRVGQSGSPKQVKPVPQGLPFLSLDGEQQNPLFWPALGGSPSFNVAKSRFFEEPTWLASIQPDSPDSYSVEDFSLPSGGLTGLDRKIAAEERQSPIIQRTAAVSAPRVRVPYRPGAMKREANPSITASTSSVFGNGSTAGVGSGAHCPSIVGEGSGELELVHDRRGELPASIKDNMETDDARNVVLAVSCTEGEGVDLHRASLHPPVAEDTFDSKVKTDMETGDVVGEATEELAESLETDKGPRWRGKLVGGLLVLLAVGCPVGLYLLQQWR